jgi:transcriptional regulator with XRE-family HTH domain
MNSQVSQKQIGQRLAGLRKLKGFSQEDLAKRVHISRPSLAQIELGNRSVNVLELQQLSFLLGFSLDDFMSPNFQIDQMPTSQRLENEIGSTERNATPTLQLGKLKNVLLYLIEKCAGKPNAGEQVLFKLLYFSDFNYFELYEEQLTGATYRKLPYGPVPDGIDVIIQQMLEQGQVQRVKTEFQGQPQIRYLPLAKTDLTQLKASEKEVIDRVIEQLGDWSATAINHYAHQDMPWKATKEGEAIHYELAFYRGFPYSVRNYNED